MLVNVGENRGKLQISNSQSQCYFGSCILCMRRVYENSKFLREILNYFYLESRFWYGLPNQTEGSSKRNRKRQDLSEDRLFVVVVGTAERRFGLVVDNLLNQQEMVIKSMGNLMTDIPCLAGGAILGNGEVVLVLDIGELEDHFRSKSRQQQVA